VDDEAWSKRRQQFNLKQADLPRAFHYNGLCKPWGANKVNYGQFSGKQRMNATNGTKQKVYGAKQWLFKCVMNLCIFHSRPLQNNNAK